MKNWIRNHKKLSGILIVVAVAVMWAATPYPRGMLMAEVDYIRGHYEVKTYGFPGPWRDRFAELLQVKYGVHVNEVAGCFVTPWLTAYADGYNQVSMANLQRKFGKDIFKECSLEAKDEWRGREQPH